MSIVIHTAINVTEGDGVTLKRLMPIAGLPHSDPFVLWDHFDLSAGGFPDHPHRGFEAITYLFAGGMRHTDNLGNRGTVHAGGAQCFTAGRGIVHSEFPDGHAHGIQLWINLPKRLKSLEPAYQQLQADMVSEECHDGVTIRTIAGEGGAINLHSEIEYLDIKITAACGLQRAVAEDSCGFVYMVSGAVGINGNHLEAGQAAFVKEAAQLEICNVAATEARLMWCVGHPHGEPIHQHGPFVD